VARALILLSLLLILLAGGYFRLIGRNWDEHQHQHPDERFLTMVETSLQPVRSLGEYFDTAQSTLNPHNRGYGFFVYGTLPIFIVRYVGEMVSQVGYDEFTQLGRSLSALFDLGALVVLFFIARRLFDDRVALLATALAAGTVLLIQHSHFFVVDTFANFFVVAAFYFIVRVGQEGRLTNYALAGLFFGMAVASKINVWTMGAVIALAGAVYVLKAFRSSDRERSPILALQEAIIGVVLAAVVAVVAFRVFQPYAFQGPGFFTTQLNPAWLSNMSEVQRLVNGDMDYPPGHQWTDRWPYWFPWVNMVAWGMGIPLGLTAWAGWLLALFQGVRRRSDGLGLILGYLGILLITVLAWIPLGSKAAFVSLGLTGLWVLGWLTVADREWGRVILPAAWVALTFAYQGGQFVKALRYLLQIYPFLILLGAWFLVWLWDKSTGQWVNKSTSVPSRHRLVTSLLRSFIALLILGVLGGTLAYAYGFTRIYTRPLTRVAATRWIYDNVPAGATVYYQTADGRQLQTQVGLPYGYVYSADGAPNVTSFTLREPGMVTAVSMNFLADPNRDPEPETFEVVVATEAGLGQPLARATITAHLEAASGPRGARYEVAFSPVTLEAGRQYYLITQVLAGAPVQSFASHVANEHWDDAIPLRMEGRDGFGMYKGIELHMYAEDEPGKLEEVVQWLDDADYIFLTSNRLYGSIPRLPMRYPMTTRYYQLLFAEQLGFKRIQTFESYPSLGPLTLPDQETAADALHAAGIQDVSALVAAGERPSGWFPRAEEAFSVYDHPRVVMFQKAENFSPERVRELLDDVQWDEIRRLWPRDATREAWLARLGRIPLAGGAIAGLLSRGEEAQPAAGRTTAEPDLMLSPADQQVQQAGGTWSRMFPRDSLVNRHRLVALIVWLLTVEVLGFIAFPVAFIVFRNVGDRGFILSKTLGLLLVSYGAWLLASLRWLPYTRLTIALVALAVAAVSGLIAWSRRRALASFLRARRRLLLISEGLFFAFFFAFLMVRWGNPDLWHPVVGGEKPMDFAYLNAVMKSTYFPPYDPWFAGGYINYYYFGFVVVGSLIKLTAILPNVAYNLTIPLLFALTAMGAFGVVYNLVERAEGEGTEGTRGRVPSVPPGSLRSFGYAFLGALFVAVIGNLGEAQLILQGLGDLSGLQFRSTIPGLEALVKALVGWSKVALDGQALPFRIEWWYWNPTRVIPETINELPFFTFLYADLHAHMIALPLTLLALGLAVNALRRLRTENRGPVGPVTIVASWLVFALAVGVLRPTNTWDYPTYLVVALAAFALREYQRRGRIDLGMLWATGWRAALLVALSALLFQPYASHYFTAYTTAELWRGARSALGDYLTIHGFFLFVVVTLLLVEVWHWIKIRDWRLVIGTLVISALFALLKLPVLALAFPPAVLGLVLLLRREVAPERAFLPFLIVLALALTMAVEVVVLKGDIGRMNTVFKFYLQVWVLLAVSAAAGLAWIAQALRSGPQDLRRAWWGAFAVLLAACLLYPVFATRAKVNDRFVREVGPTLDGMAYMDRAVYHDGGDSARGIGPAQYELRYDRQAIEWLRDHVEGSPVILEGHAVEYRWGSRYAIYTGLPAVIGWNWHQRQQRSVYREPRVEQRIADVRAIYDTTDVNQALDLLRKYNVRYIIVGQMERAYYDPQGLAKFDRMVGQELELVYENPGVRIYRLKGT